MDYDYDYGCDLDCDVCYPPLVKEVDPELERLLQEEEEIEQRTAISNGFWRLQGETVDYKGFFGNFRNYSEVLEVLKYRKDIRNVSFEYVPFDLPWKVIQERF